mmetsp:Transcript_16867/g.25524  ORF Transcript_16867/g.25524 Transcript_16867/m.25524 type:complete len:93 (+) Transcript_16867:51-329(+)|eukprot:CAMPEP_0206500476 /NCGR_PEP_ID=MMETSP0324_2-20121206/52492_1 /ASSEMBLY_ACC=CAM_ASM_000836 /TAXON_ID=2866 /ORGANISM="Crypthecodinium cohnii, Strain Seligo" /LENGTH=92 /DNA_ID=CAMNT_0053987621 /DNA_START=27 /DNA_END=305 /DNA_ORIENTATION=+
MEMHEKSKMESHDPSRLSRDLIIVWEISHRPGYFGPTNGPMLTEGAILRLGGGGYQEETVLRPPKMQEDDEKESQVGKDDLETPSLLSMLPT